MMPLFSLTHSHTLLMTSSLPRAPALASLDLGVGVAAVLTLPGRRMGPHTRQHSA